MRRKAKLQTNAINSASLTIISVSSTAIDESQTVIIVAPAVNSVKETIVSAREIIIGERAIIISGPNTLIFIPEKIIGETPAIVCGSVRCISVTQIAISAFGTSFLEAEISLSAAGKTAGAAPADLFPIASQPSTNRLAFVLMAEVRPGGQS